MRRKLLSGAHEWIGAEELIRSLIVWMLSARKIEGSFKFVMRRVLEGGVGCESGGIVDKSMDMFGERLPREEGRDESGVLSRDIL